MHINFGAGNPAQGWINIDSSPHFMIPISVHKFFSLFKISQRSNDFINHQYTYYKFSINKQLPFKNNSVSAIFTSHVLEHLSIDENSHFFKEAKRILKKMEY